MIVETELGARPGFVDEIEQKQQMLYFENSYLREESARVKEQVNGVIKPRFEQKLNVRDTLEKLYDGQVKSLSKDVQMTTLKTAEGNKTIIDGLPQS